MSEEIVRMTVTKVELMGVLGERSERSSSSARLERVTAFSPRVWDAKPTVEVVTFLRPVGSSKVGDVVEVLVK